MREAIASAAFWIGARLCTVAAYLAAAAHILTVIIAFKASGFLAALVSLVLPFLSQIYWCWRLWSETGEIWSVLAVSVAWVVGLRLLGMAMMAAGALSSRG